MLILQELPLKTIRNLLIILTVSFISHNLFGQAEANFTADDTLGCTPFTVHFTNTGSTGPNFDYLWTFGSLGTRTEENPVFTFSSPGDIPVTLLVTNTSTSEQNSITKYIHVILTPSASFTIDSTNACVNGNVQFHLSSSIDSASWNFGDGLNELGISNYMNHIYTAHGFYDVQCITYYEECSDTSGFKPVHVDGPIADFSFDPADACKGSPVEFTMNAVSDVENFTWELDEDVVIHDQNPVSHSYNTIGYIPVSLTVTGSTGSCTIEKIMHIWEVEADFEYADTRCDQQPVAFENTSVGNELNSWDFGNGSSSLAENPTATYVAGTYTVKLKIENDHSCKDSIEKEIIIHALPEIILADHITVCPDVETTLEASGGDVIYWTPASAFNDPASYTPVIMPDSTTVYTATITNNTTHCVNSDSIRVIVQEGFIQGKISVWPLDSTIIVGDSVAVFVYDTLSRMLTYEWSSDDPDMRISCNDCSNPTMQPLHSITYYLVISDTNRCFQSEQFEVAIEVREEYRIGVPDAFTPNQDGINDIIKVDGWGIQELIEFRIFNRWGTEVFNTTDISEGWDGYYKDKLQNVDTYSYIIRAKMWDENTTVVQGTFSLLR